MNDTSLPVGDGVDCVHELKKSSGLNSAFSTGAKICFGHLKLIVLQLFITFDVGNGSFLLNTSTRLA